MTTRAEQLIAALLNDADAMAQELGTGTSEAAGMAYDYLVECGWCRNGIDGHWQPPL